MTNTYEHLSGGTARSRFFRTERYAAREWLNRVRAALDVDGEARNIHDLSMNGIAFYAPSLQEAPEVGASTPLRLLIGDTVAFEGRGEVTRAETTSRGAKIAVRLEGGFLDIPRIMALHDELALDEELARGPVPDAEGIPVAYRVVCADTVHLLRRYRSILDRYEALLPKDDPQGQRRLQEVYDNALLQFRAEWGALRVRANELIGAFDAPTRASAKRYTESVVTPEFMQADVWRRCYEKPLGYPGDFEVMNYLYAGKAIGETAFERMLFQVGLEQPLAACVPHRGRELTARIKRAVAGCDRPAKITSLGCGPAKEVEAYLMSNVPQHGVHFTLIDQDYAALSQAYAQIIRQASRLGDRVTAECLYVSFVQFLRDAELFGRLPEQDLIYSAGLFDYLELPHAQQLAFALYQKVAPGGSLIIGNMRSPTTGEWSLEYIADWTLVYRTEQDMRDIAQYLPDAKIDVMMEATEHTYLLTLTKA
jgi:hypothetical protein